MSELDLFFEALEADEEDEGDVDAFIDPDKGIVLEALKMFSTKIGIPLDSTLIHQVPYSGHHISKYAISLSSPDDQYIKLTKIELWFYVNRFADYEFAKKDLEVAVYISWKWSDAVTLAKYAMVNGSRLQQVWLKPGIKQK